MDRHPISLNASLYGKRAKVLFICGSLNQTTQMHQIAHELPNCDAVYSPFYCDGFLDHLRKARLLETTILGEKLVKKCLSYLRENKLPIDYQGRQNNYDLVVTCTDLIVPKNICGTPIVLVQEGMTDPETWRYFLVRKFPTMPKWFAGTAATGLSHRYDRFCVASEGYRDLFIGKGIAPEKIAVTGIPNFDNCKKFLVNDFSEKHFVLVCTSDWRETGNHENRKKFIRRAVTIADGRTLVFKLHPNENVKRATREIRWWAPGAVVCHGGSTEEMIANCDVLITRYSTTAYVGLALGKEVHSDFDVEQLRRLTPLQNGCAAANIAAICRDVIGLQREAYSPKRHKFSTTKYKNSIPLTTEVVS